VADVPVGAYLSGGVDSSLIVGLMAAQASGGQLSTFSAGFGSDSLDELPFAREVSKHFQTSHHEVHLQADDYIKLWAPLTWHRDAPISEASDMAVHSLARLASEHVKVVMSGEGSDELFGGYPKHQYAGFTRAAGLAPSAVRSAVLTALESRLPPHQVKFRTAVRALLGDTERDRYEAWFGSFTPAETRALTGRDPRQPSMAPLDRHGDALRRMLVTDTRAWLPDNLLERADRMSMAASLETRPPFLDRDVVEFAFGLPSTFKVRRGASKWVVKQLALPLLPPGIVDRPKAGFRAPLSSWFKSGLRDMAWSRLLDQSSFAAQVLDRDTVESLLRRHDSGSTDEAVRIWTLLALEVWHDVFYSGEVPLTAPSTT
jgi:asparagine synthase (glutamine-hydrolysing)